MSLIEPDRPRVYIVNFQTKNFSSAKKFGELVFITQGFLDLTKIDELREKFSRYVELASPSDCLILNGPAVVNTLLTVLWFKKFGYLNILSWDGRSLNYSHNVVGVNDATGSVTIG